MKLKLQLLTVIGITLTSMVIPATVQSQLGFEPEGKALFWHQTYDATDTEPLRGGGLAYIWSGTDLTGHKRVRLQIVESNGDLLFGDQSLVISQDDVDAFNPQMAAHPDGGIYACWCEFRQNGAYVEKLQRFDRRGNAMWGNGGIEIADVRLGQPNVVLKVDSDGGVLLAPVMWDINGQIVINRLFAFTENGTPKEGWPEQGLAVDSLLIKEIQPDSRGGFWIRKSMDFHRIARLNRLSADCRWQWENDVIIESPVNLIETIECKSNGDYLFMSIRNGWGGRRETGFNVYGPDGQLLRSELVPVADTSNIALWLVSRENRIFLVYDLGYDCEGDWGQYGSVRLMRYDPLSEDNRFPWGDRGIPFREPNPERSAYLFNISMIKVNDVLMIFSREQGRSLNVLTTGEEPEWLGDAHEIDEISGFVDGFGECEEAWCNFGDLERSARFTEEGELATGEDPIIVRPHLTDREGSVAFQLIGDRLCMQLNDPERGLCGQILNSRGEGASPLNPSQIGLPANWLSGNFTSGVVGDIQWFCDDDVHNANRFRFTFLNDQNQLLDTQMVDMESSKLRYIGNNHSNRLLFYNSNQNNGFDFLYLLDTQGEIIAREQVYFPEEYMTIKNAWFWPGNGWLVALESNNHYRTYLELFDNSLHPCWVRPTCLDQRVCDARMEGDQIQVAGLRFLEVNSSYTGFRTSLFSNGVIRDSDSASIFNTVQPPLTTQSIRIDEIGNIWYQFQHGQDSYVQLISSQNLQRCLGDSGLRISAAPNTFHLTLDAEDGAWLAWSDTSGVAKILHLDNEGIPWHNQYPLEGFDLFDEDNIYVERLFAEEESNHVWAIGRKRTEFNYYSVLYGYKAQLISDEWLTAKNKERIYPSLPSLSAFPNPFNSSTTISYSLPSPGRYAIDVIDIQGRLVQRLSGGWKEAGRYRQIWDGRNWTSGQYIVRLNANNEIFGTPVTLIK